MPQHDPKQSGFSLIEMVVSILMFSIIMTTVGAIFTRILSLQRRGLGAQKVQENTMFMLEAMAREIRVSRVDNQDAPGCNATTLTMTHPINGAVTYTYDVVGKRVRRTQGGVTGDMTGADVQVNRMNFCILGSGTNDNQQARITMVVGVQNKAVHTQDMVVFDLQTTVTSRDITTEYQN